MAVTFVHKAIAAIDAVIGFFLLFGGLNLAFRLDYPTEDSTRVIVGLASMLTGLALFLSASRIMRSRIPVFRPAIYWFAAIGTLTMFALQYLKKNPPISRADVVTALIVTVICIGCSLLQLRLLGG